MNKKWIEDNIIKAYNLIGEAKIAENGNLSKTFRGYISTFGAAVTMGSLKAAIAFYSKESDSARDREKLMQIIHALIEDDNKGNSLMDYVKNSKNERVAKMKICDAAIAVKLAMNMYNLVEGGRGNEL